MGRQTQGQWLSFHIYYHEDRDRILIGLVRPLIAELLRERWIDNFFFVRYMLGGPHIRLRLFSSFAEEVEDLVRRRLNEFLEVCPSRQPLDTELIRKINDALSNQITASEDNDIYPDNSIRKVPCLFEIERYGGPGLIDSSLDFFAVSSARALRTIEESGFESGKRLISAFCILLQYTLNFARDAEDLLDLVADFPPIPWKRAPQGVLCRSQESYEKKKVAFQTLLRGEMEGLYDEVFCGDDRRAARLLAEVVEMVDFSPRKRILKSQLHMAMNRLGLTNLEEVYVSRILWQSIVDQGDVVLPTRVVQGASRAEELTSCVRQALQLTFLEGR
jgi:hypothetical protein